MKPHGWIIIAVILLVSLAFRWYGSLLNRRGMAEGSASKRPRGEKWPFEQPRHEMVFVTVQVMEEREPVLYVSRDGVDRSWQFVGRTAGDEGNGRLMSLEQVVALDPSLRQIASLRPGEAALRYSPSGPWVRRPAPGDNRPERDDDGAEE